MSEVSFLSGCSIDDGRLRVAITFVIAMQIIPKWNCTVPPSFKAESKAKLIYINATHVDILMLMLSLAVKVVAQWILRGSFENLL